MKNTFLYLIILFVTPFSYAQEEEKDNGLVAYGKTFYKYQYSRLNEDGSVDTQIKKVVDTVSTDFSVSINTTKKFINVKDAGEFPHVSLKFDTIEVEDIYQMYADINLTQTYDEQGYQAMKELTFDFEWDLNNKVVPATGKMYYDMEAKQIMLNIAIVENGNGYQYFFILNKIFHVNWEYGHIMTKKVIADKERIVEIGKDNDELVFLIKPSEFLITDTEVSFTEDDFTTLEEKETITEPILFRRKKNDFVLIYTKSHLLAAPIYLKNRLKCYYYFDLDTDKMEYTKKGVYSINVED